MNRTTFQIILVVWSLFVLFTGIGFGMWINRKPLHPPGSKKVK